MNNYTLHLSPAPTLPPFRPLHGVNNGPFLLDGLLDLSPQFRQARIPDVRLHDPLYPARNVVDINAVFPNANADPDDPASYDFARTDHYLQHIAATGATITYRLGYTIEHHPIKRYCLLPPDLEKWARICLGIARHYHAGWAHGFTKLVNRWEIWNEPDLMTTLDQPSMTSPTFRGSWRDYFRLYELTAGLLKQRLPDACIGGTAVTGLAIRSGFLAAFLEFARAQQLPLDFLSWHTYTPDVFSIPEDAREVRRMLDAAGFAPTESLLTEWHFTPPGADWRIIMTPSDPIKKRQLHADMTGDRAATFTAAALLLLQDAPLDMANFYIGDTMIFFGLFDDLGTPLKPYYALLAFSELLACTHRLSVTTAAPSTAAPSTAAPTAGTPADPLPKDLLPAAGLLPAGRIRLLLVNHRPEYASVHLRLPGNRPPAADTPCRLLSNQYDLTPWALDDDFVHLPAWSLAVVDLAC